MAGGFIQRSRHGTVFLFRRRVPRDLRDRFGKAHIYVSLRTEELAQARRLARQLAVATDRLFLELRYMPTDSASASFRLDYGLTFDSDERGNPRLTILDAKPGDESSIEDAARRVLALAMPLATPAATSASPTVNEAIQAVLASPDIKPTTAKEYRRAFEHFRRFAGAETPLSDIRAERFSEYADLVRGSTDWSPKTQGFYITSAQRLFTFFAARCSAVPQISTKGLKPRRTAPESLDRAAYSLDELEAVFRSALRYRDAEPAKWWATVASAFLGTRIEELCQAHVDGDFMLDASSGIYFLQIDEITRGCAPHSKSVKTQAGWRKVPIHPCLVRAGFVQFIESQQRAGHSTPFQTCWPPFIGADGVIKHSRYVSKWSQNEMRKLQAAGLVPSKVTYFHSMRHTFTTLLSKADVGEEWRAALCGQQYGGINAKVYDKAKQDVTATLPRLQLGLKPLEEMFQRVLGSRQRKPDDGSW